MAERVFPKNSTIKIDSSIAFNALDWNSIKNDIESNRFAQQQDETLQEVLEEISKMTDIPMDVLENKLEEFQKIEDRMMDGGEPESDSFSEMEEGMNETENISESATDPQESEASNTMNKISFTHPSQLSAEAIEAAQKAGDVKRVNTILAARKANRERIAKMLLSNQRTASEEFLSLFGDETDNFNMNEDEDMLSGLGDDIDLNMDQDFSMDDEFTMDEGLNVKNTIDRADDLKDDVDFRLEESFKSPDKFSEAERSTFRKVALASGFPKEFVDAVCSPKVNTTVENLANEINRVCESGLSAKSQTAAIKALIKEAGLSPDSKREFIRYWNDILGYQDKEFWPDAAKDYTTKSNKEN